MQASSILQCLVIYESAVISKRIGLFLVFCVRPPDEGRHAKAGLVDTLLQGGPRLRP